MLRRTFIAALSSFAAAAAFGQSHIDAGTVQTETGRLGVPVYSVAITSPDANMAALAKRAFGLHGSYKIVPRQNAQFVFDFASAGANSVRLSISKGLSFESVCEGSSAVEALMKACDAAVLRTLRSPRVFRGDDSVFIFPRQLEDFRDMRFGRRVPKRALDNPRQVGFPHAALFAGRQENPLHRLF